MSLNEVYQQYERMVFLIEAGGITVDTRYFDAPAYYDFSGPTNKLLMKSSDGTKEVTIAEINLCVTTLGFREGM